MEKAVRRGKLDSVPEKRRLLYESYYHATWQRIHIKAVFLIRAHERHRSNGSCSLERDLEELISEGYIRVLVDPKPCPTARDWAHDMFRQMENFLSAQRRKRASDKTRHEPLDDQNPQTASVYVIPTPRHDELYEQRRMLDDARNAVAAVRPQFLQLFDLMRTNHSIDEIAKKLGRTAKQVTSDAYRLRKFLTSHFNTGDHS